MRFSSALALGAASTASAFQDQQVLSGGAKKPVIDSSSSSSESWMAPLENLFGEITSEAKGIWDEVSLLMPDAVEAFKQQAMRTNPKPATRRPDSEWDHIVKGAEVHDLWINDESKSEVDSSLKTYNLRAKSVDPSKLGIDTVKQYSGYLDEEEEDKHLFYCEH
jgi:cathepsin A (carboxypeptidase C)